MASIPSIISRARGTSGTRCSRRHFMRSAGTLQTAAPTSISDQSAPRASPLLAAHKIRNSSERADMDWRSRSSRTKVGTSSKGIAAWWPRESRLGRGSSLSRCPRHRAGFSFVRRPLARAASSTASTRPRSRDAISGLVCQTGRRMLRTSWVVISATDFSRRGFAYISAPRRGSRAPRDASHCSRCLAFFSEGAIAARYSSATSPNVTGRGGACAAFEARLPSIGSSPAPTSRRASAASARAFASGTSLAEPRPISRSLPGGETGKPTGARHARRCSGRAHHHPHDARDPEEPRPSGRLTGAVPDPCSPLCPNFCPNFGAGFYGTTADAQRRSRNKAEENHENTVG